MRNCSEKRSSAMPKIKSMVLSLYLIESLSTSMALDSSVCYKGIKKSVMDLACLGEEFSTAGSSGLKG